MKLGDVFQYKEEFFNGIKTSNHIIVFLTKTDVICTLEIFYEEAYFEAIKDESFKIPMRKIKKEKFKEWYPTYLYNKFDFFGEYQS